MLFYQYKEILKFGTRNLDDESLLYISILYDKSLLYVKTYICHERVFGMEVSSTLLIPHPLPICSFINCK